MEDILKELYWLYNIENADDIDKTIAHIAVENFVSGVKFGSKLMIELLQT